MDNANAGSAASPQPMKGSSLTQRVLSVLVLLPIIMLVVWWNYWAVAVFVGGVVVIALIELYATFSHGGYQPLTWVGIPSGLLLLLSVVLRPLKLPFDLLPPALVVMIISSLLATLPRDREPQTLVSWALTFAGTFYVAWLFSYLVALRGLDTPLRAGPLASLGMPAGAAWLFTVMAVTWLQDTFAYFVGKRWGRAKMAPTLSPKKTWEGAAGGFFGAVVGALLSVVVFCLPISFGAAVLLGVVGGIVGPLGDLAESLMKRQLGLKDAGNLIPGHGGVLDRGDSLLFTAPVLYYLILLLVR